MMLYKTLKNKEESVEKTVDLVFPEKNNKSIFISVLIPSKLFGKTQK